SAEQAINIARGNYAAAQATLTSAQAQLAKLQAGATDEERAIAKLQIDRAKDSLWAYQNQRDAIGGYDDKSAEYTLARGNVAIAETDVQIAQIQYDQMLKGARTEDLTMAQADVSQAQAAVSTQSAQVAQAKAALDSAKAGVTQAEASLIIAKAQLEQRKADVDSAAAAVQQAQAQLDLLKAGTRAEDLAVAEAAVAQAEAVLSEAQNALDDAVLQAPFDGTVGELLVEQGELVVPQATVVRFGDLTVMEVETTDLSEVDIDQVQVGQKATVSIDALDGKEFAGTVASIGTIAGASRGDTVYRVVIDLSGADISQLRWGMSAFVEITVR
ncbi:MAG: efflux RND transporter periplasmic adaptor subunit, partial [Anaerolineales bacterium]